MGYLFRTFVWIRCQGVVDAGWRSRLLRSGAPQFAPEPRLRPACVTWEIRRNDTSFFESHLFLTTFAKQTNERQMKYKAIFSDLDGTLVSFKTHKVPESAKQAIEEARRKGVKFFHLHWQTIHGSEGGRGFAIRWRGRTERGRMQVA